MASGVQMFLPNMKLFKNEKQVFDGARAIFLLFLVWNYLQGERIEDQPVSANLYENW